MKEEDLSTARITSLAALERAVAEIGSLFARPNFPIWRGHAHAAWPLRADVFRAPAEGRRYDERALLRLFLAQAKTRHAACPAPSDATGWLLLARQSGLPTRLMEWSRSPLVALYFAAQPDPARSDADGCLWAIDPGVLNLRLTRARTIAGADDATVRPLFAAAFGGGSELEADSAVAVQPREPDARVLVQQSCFTLHQDGKDLTELDHRTVIDPLQPNPVWRRAFLVPRTHKRHLLDMLAAFGIHRAALFPDLDALADELRRTVPRPTVEVTAAL